MEKRKMRKAYRKPSWRKQEVVENFAMQAACKVFPKFGGCCGSPNS